MHSQDGGSKIRDEVLEKLRETELFPGVYHRKDSNERRSLNESSSAPDDLSIATLPAPTQERTKRSRPEGNSVVSLLEGEEAQIEPPVAKKPCLVIDHDQLQAIIDRTRRELDDVTEKSSQVNLRIAPLMVEMIRLNEDKWKKSDALNQLLKMKELLQQLGPILKESTT